MLSAMQVDCAKKVSRHAHMGRFMRTHSALGK
jgi:hypothetical protein